MKRPCISVLILFTLAILATGTFAGVSQAADAIEWDTDRQGQDYRDFWLSDPLPESCRRACDNEARCRAWTFVKPGILGPQAKCWLKSGVPQKTTDACCVSGVKGGAQAAAGTGPDVPPTPRFLLSAAQLTGTKKQAEGGDVQAMAVLGLYHSGDAAASDSEPRSLDEAIRWYERAADKGDAGAMASLGMIFESRRKDNAKATQWFRKAANAGDVLAMSVLSQLYEQGKSVPKDAAKSFEWAQKAAQKSSDENAAYVLAEKYFHGEGTRQDFVEAAHWYRVSADKGSSLSMLKLAQQFNSGKGLTKDVKRSFELAKLAADAGEPLAMYRIGLYFLQGIGTHKNPAMAKKWLDQAADRGEVNAMQALSYVYDNGLGITANPAIAADWAIRAIRAQALFAADTIMRKPWSRSAAFRKELQKRLKGEGFYLGKIDGKFGPGTRKAIAALSNSGAAP